MRQALLNGRVFIFGLLSWLIPFAVSIPFYSPEHGLIIPLLLFKSIMIVIGTLVGVILLVYAFRSVPPNAVSGLTIGIYWLLINWGLDILVLVPLSGSTIWTWFGTIGLRYLSIPIISTGMGLVAFRRA